MRVFNFLKDQIIELTDLSENSVTKKTLIEDINLISLDYVSIQVALKKEFGVVLNLDEYYKRELTTLGEFSQYIEELI